MNTRAVSIWTGFAKADADAHARHVHVGAESPAPSADKPARLEIQPVDEAGKETMPAQVIGGAPGELPLMARFDLPGGPPSPALHVADRVGRGDRSLGAVAGGARLQQAVARAGDAEDPAREEHGRVPRHRSPIPTASPTASTRFGGTDRVLVEIEYQALGGQTPQIKVDLLNAKGDLLRTLPTSPPADGRLRMPLPVSSLANSTYVLRIEATAGEQTRPAVGRVPRRALDDADDPAARAGLGCSPRWPPLCW